VAERHPKVLLIGPVLPFRGGIAQHTTMLLRAFAETTEAHAISFTRQYPRFLFPGESDRDPAFEGHVEPLTEYEMDSMNPLSWRRVVRKALAFAPDVVVLPWWQVYWAPSFSYIARRLRRAGIPVVFLCHNVIEHEWSQHDLVLWDNLACQHARPDVKVESSARTLRKVGWPLPPLEKEQIVGSYQRIPAAT
jgi:glycosyltransferase involved in cell wall biosynthesis